jgi:hypothetical protein
VDSLKFSKQAGDLLRRLFYLLIFFVLAFSEISVIISHPHGRGIAPRKLKRIKHAETENKLVREETIPGDRDWQNNRPGRKQKPLQIEAFVPRPRGLPPRQGAWLGAQEAD